MTKPQSLEGQKAALDRQIAARDFAKMAKDKEIANLMHNLKLRLWAIPLFLFLLISCMSIAGLIK